jgi:hypothetical protein
MVFIYVHRGPKHLIFSTIIVDGNQSCEIGPQYLCMPTIRS